MLIKFGRLVAAALIVSGLVARVHAQEVSDDIVKATVGEWLIVSEDGSLGCHITLGKQKTIGGRVVTEGKICGPPWRDQIAAWKFESPGIVLRDATRKEVVGFGEREVGPWVTDIERSPRIYFVPEPGRLDRAATEKEAVGKWLLTDAKGTTLCHLELLATASKRSDDSKRLQIDGDCAARVKKTKIEAWKIDEIKLTIIGGEDYIYLMAPDADGFVTDDGKFHLKRGG
jgi:hypothetical protein